MTFRILYQDPYLVAIDKPAGFHVHPPEDATHMISPAFNCLSVLRKQLGTYLYPVHRLDRATSGVLLFALEQSAARELCDSFKNREVKKTYFCVTRGWTEEKMVIDRALKSDGPLEERLPSLTSVDQVSQIELPLAVGKYGTARYSLLKVDPHTGRRHQIRRHLAYSSNPILGDTTYGDGAHNRVFRENLGISGLLLKAYSIEIRHPSSGENLKLTSRWNGTWHKVFDLFGVCPYGG